jgi:hypothetical protein
VALDQGAAEGPTNSAPVGCPPLTIGSRIRDYFEVSKKKRRKSTKPPSRPNIDFRFRKHDSIGASAAEDDEAFLADCFVDTGELGFLRSAEDHRCIVVGRTGSGKSALLARLASTSQRVVPLNPETLGLTYICNSNVLAKLESVGVNVEVFYKMLWRHVIAVEVLRERFDSKERENGFFEKLAQMFDGSRKREHAAINYLKKHQESEFWADPQSRVRKLTSSFEAKVSAKAGVDGFSVKAGNGAQSSEGLEIVHQAQRAINELHSEDLTGLLDVLKGVLADSKRCYYVTVDRLDENWAEEARRYKLIMALIEAAREFRHVPGLKVIVALRRDLLERVFRVARSTGFQKEKYESSLLPLRWTTESLFELLDARVARLVRSRYTGSPVGFTDLLAEEADGQPARVLLAKLLRRPRDVISFFNCCIEEAADRPTIAADALNRALGKYSRSRFDAACDEWHGDYPNLQILANGLKKRPPSFKLGRLVDDAKLLGEIAGDLARAQFRSEPEERFRALVIEHLDLHSAVVDLAIALYRSGLVGLKTDAIETASWIEESGRDVSRAEVGVETSLVVHAAFHRVLGVDVRASQQGGAAAGGFR